MDKSKNQKLLAEKREYIKVPRIWVENIFDLPEGKRGKVLESLFAYLFYGLPIPEPTDPLERVVMRTVKGYADKSMANYINGLQPKREPKRNASEGVSESISEPPSESQLPF